MNISPISFGARSYKKPIKKSSSKNNQNYTHKPTGLRTLSNGILANVQNPNGKIYGYEIINSPDSIVFLDYDKQIKTLRAFEMITIGNKDKRIAQYQFREVIDPKEVQSYYNKGIEDNKLN